MRTGSRGSWHLGQRGVLEAPGVARPVNGQAHLLEGTAADQDVFPRRSDGLSGEGYAVRESKIDEVDLEFPGWFISTVGPDIYPLIRRGELEFPDDFLRQNAEVGTGVDHALPAFPVDPTGSGDNLEIADDRGRVIRDAVAKGVAEILTHLRRASFDDLKLSGVQIDIDQTALDNFLNQHRGIGKLR